MRLVCMKLNGPSFAKLDFAEVEKPRRDYQETVEFYRETRNKEKIQRIRKRSEKDPKIWILHRSYWTVRILIGDAPNLFSRLLCSLALWNRARLEEYGAW